MGYFTSKSLKLIMSLGLPAQEPVLIGEPEFQPAGIGEQGAAASLDVIDLVQQKSTAPRPSAAVIEASRFTEPGLLASIVVQFTGRCNLRCVYCPQGTDLNQHNYDDAEAKLLTDIAGYIEKQEIQSVHLGVYGETLVYEGWPRFAQAYLDAGASLSVTTNLSKHLSDEELDVLSRFNLIFVSIDTLDLPLLKKIRTTDGRLVLYNFHRVRSYALQKARTVPNFAWSVTVSTAVIPHLEAMLPLAKRYGVKYLFMNDLSSYEGLEHGLQNIFELDGAEFAAAAATLDRALAFCSRAGIQANAPWKERLDKERQARKNAPAGRGTAENTEQLHYTNIQGSALWYSEPLAPGMTRMCLQPWNSMVVMPKGEIYTCCQRGVSMGYAKSAAELDDVRNGPEYVDLRGQLMSGQVTDETCRNCQTMPAVTPDKLMDGIRNMIYAKDAKNSKR